MATGRGLLLPVLDRDISMRELFQSLAHSGDGAFIIDNSHKVIFWNEAAERILGIPANEAKGLYCYEVLGGRDNQGRTLCQRYCWVAMNAQQSDPVPSIDVNAQTASGARTWINVTTFAVPMHGLGNGQMIVHLFRDANQKKRNEHLVEEFRQMAKRVRGEINTAELASITRKPEPEPYIEDLTARQSEVLLLLTHGLGTAEIAETLTISVSTVRNHIQAILNKLGVHSRLEAVAYAYQHKLIDDDSGPLRG